MMNIKWAKDPLETLKHHSTKALGFLVFLTGSWLVMPAEMQASFPPEITSLMGYATFVAAVYGLYGKFTQQNLDPK